MCATHACLDASSLVVRSVFVSTEFRVENFFHFKIAQLLINDSLSSFNIPILLHILPPSGLYFSDLQLRVHHSNPFSIFVGDQGGRILIHPVAALHYHVWSMLQVSHLMFWLIFWHYLLVRNC